VITGYYSDGKTSTRVAARLEVVSQSPAILMLRDTGNSTELQRSDLADIKISSRLGNIPREFVFADGGLFVSPQNQQIDTVLKTLKSDSGLSLIHRLESNIGLVLSSVVLALLFGWLTVTQGIPRAADMMADNIPEVMAEQFDQQMTVLDSTLFDPSNLPDTEQERVRQLFQPYLDQHSQLNPKLHIRSGIGVNALAFPGGDIVFSDELIERAANDQQLVSVLFHELGHLQHRHFLRRTLQDSMLVILLLFVVGDIESLDMVMGIPALLADLSYSRDFEREADLFALQQMHSNDLDLDAFGTMMLLLSATDEGQEEMQEEDKASEYDFEALEGFLSTHPKSEDRAAMVEEFKAGLR
jgi:Zn-dependent protease with chaperone function